MESSKIKHITLPVNIRDLDKDIMSGTVYIIDYSSSPYKGNDLLNYLEQVGITADVDLTNVSYDDKEKLIESYMTSESFFHFVHVNVAIMNCIYLLKNSKIRLKESCLTSSEEERFMNRHKELLERWIEFFDSYLVYMITVASNKDTPVIKRYPKHRIVFDKTLGTNAVSPFLDGFFYDYFQTGIDNSHIKYWQFQYDNKLYDGIPFLKIMLNEENWVFKVLHKTAKLKGDEDFLNQLKNSLEEQS